MLNNRRGFTLVELSIVLAVIGILLAVAMPSFTNTDQKSRIKADTTLLYAYNCILDAEAGATSMTAMTDALNELRESGYGDEVFETTSGFALGWDTDNARFVLIDSAEHMCYTPDGEGGFDSKYIEEADRPDYFIACSSPTEAVGYSLYAKPGFSVENIAAGDSETYEGVIIIKGVSFDCGSNRGLNVKFVESKEDPPEGEKDPVMLRTNGGVLTIVADNTPVHHYGTVGIINLEACNTYYEYGSPDVIYQTKANLVIEDSSDIGAICLKAQAVTANDNSITYTYQDNSICTTDENRSSWPRVYRDYEDEGTVEDRKIEDNEQYTKILIKIKKLASKTTDGVTEYVPGDVTEYICVTTDANGKVAITDNELLSSAYVVGTGSAANEIIYKDGVEKQGYTASNLSKAVCDSIKSNCRVVEVNTVSELQEAIERTNSGELISPVIVLDDPVVKTYSYSNSTEAEGAENDNSGSENTYDTNKIKSYSKSVKTYNLTEQLVISKPLSIRGDGITVNLQQGLAIEVDPDQQELVTISGVTFTSDSNNKDNDESCTLYSSTVTIEVGTKSVKAIRSVYIEDGIIVIGISYVINETDVDGTDTGKYTKYTTKTYKKDGKEYTNRITDYTNATGHETNEIEYYYEETGKTVRTYEETVDSATKYVTETTWNNDLCTNDSIKETVSGDTTTIVTTVKNKALSDVGKAVALESGDVTITETVTLQGCTRKVETVTVTTVTTTEKTTTTTATDTVITGRMLLFTGSSLENLALDIIAETDKSDWTINTATLSANINLTLNLTDCSFIYTKGDIIRYDCDACYADKIVETKTGTTSSASKTRSTKGTNTDINLTRCSFNMSRVTMTTATPDMAAVDLSCNYNCTLETVISECEFIGPGIGNSNCDGHQLYAVYLKDSISAVVENCELNDFSTAVYASNYGKEAIGELELTMQYNLSTKNCTNQLLYRDSIKDTSELPAELQGAKPTRPSGAVYYLYSMSKGTTTGQLRYEYYLYDQTEQQAETQDTP